MNKKYDLSVKKRINPIITFEGLTKEQHKRVREIFNELEQIFGASTIGFKPSIEVPMDTYEYLIEVKGTPYVMNADYTKDK